MGGRAAEPLGARAGTPIAMAPKRCTVHASRGRDLAAPDPPVISLSLDEIYGA